VPLHLHREIHYPENRQKARFVSRLYPVPGAVFDPLSDAGHLVETPPISIFIGRKKILLGGIDKKI
jgi:hypothetical protein